MIKICRLREIVVSIFHFSCVLPDENFHQGDFLIVLINILSNLSVSGKDMFTPQNRLASTYYP